MNWHEYFLSMLDLVAKKSKDRSTKNAAIIVGPDNEIRSTGYNSFPRGLNDDVPERHERPTKYSWTEHAERNAIYNAARIGISLVNCTIYQDWLPCCDCARAIIQSGISKVILDSSSPKNGNKEWDERWGESLSVSESMLKEADVKLMIYDRNKEIVKSFKKYTK